MEQYRPKNTQKRYTKQQNQYQCESEAFQKRCRFGENCRFNKQNECKYYHSPDPVIQKTHTINENDLQNNQIQQKNQQQYQHKNQQQYYQKNSQENLIQEAPKINYNEHQKKPNQSLKQFYLQMLQKNEQITQKAHYIESLQPGYSIKPGQVDQFYTEAYEQQIQEISDLQIKNQTVKIGIDFGNVIVGSDPNANDPDEDTMFGENYLQVKAIPDAIEGVKFLVEKFGADNIYIVSKAKQRMQGKSLNWMQHQDFYNKTGILEKNVIFCLERHEKAQICKENKIFYFIDDKMDVLNKMDEPIMKFLFPTQKKKNYPKGKYLKHVEGWQHLIDIFKKIKKL